MWGKGGGEAGYLASELTAQCTSDKDQPGEARGASQRRWQLEAGFKSRGRWESSGAEAMASWCSPAGRDLFLIQAVASMGLHILGTLHQLSPSEDGLLQKVPWFRRGSGSGVSHWRGS